MHDDTHEVQQRFYRLQNTVLRWETEPTPVHLQDVRTALAEAQRTVESLEQEGVYFDHPKRMLHDVVAVTTARLELAEQARQGGRR